MASIFYTEIFQSVAPSGFGVWEENDISAYLPEGDDITVEVIISNPNATDQNYLVGVRSPGSSLERRLKLFRASADGGYNSVTMHVQASGGKIELFAPTGVEFFLVGCWVGTRYTEAFSPLNPVVTNSWTNKDLSSAGVPSGAIVEIVSAQTWGGLLMGARSVGSTDNRYMTLLTGDNGNSRFNTWTSFVQSSGNNATIQYYLDSIVVNNNFYHIGYWETPPGDYTDVFQEDEANPTTNSTWEEVDVGGVPSGSVCSFAVSNSDGAASRVLGIRESGSSIERKINIISSPSFKSPICMHVNIQSPIETFSEAATGVNDNFILTGYWDNIPSEVEPVVVSGQIDMFTEGHESLLPSGTTIYYQEIFQSIAPSSPNTWEENDISAYLPEGDDITAEIVIANSNTAVGDYLVGVRGSGSILDRRFKLVPALTNGGYNTATMHVQVSGGKIELYAPTGVEFFLVGCWVGTKYIETFDFFPPVAVDSWTNKDLSSVGVPSGAIVELMPTHANGGFLMGFRSCGSTDDRYLRMEIGSDVNNRYNAWTSFVQTSGANATIQYYAEFSIFSSRFYNLGYWETPPGDFTDVFQSDEANPTTNNTWEEVDVSGVVPGSVCSFAMINSDISTSRVLGIRELGSSIERKIDVRFANNATYQLSACLHVNAQSPIEVFSEAGTDVNDDFTLLGYWDNIPSKSLNAVDLFISGSPTVALTVSNENDLFIPGVDNKSDSAILFVDGFSIISDQNDLFISGLDKKSDDIALFIGGFSTIPGQKDLFIEGLGFTNISGQIDLFLNGKDISSSSTDLFTEGIGGLTSSKNLFEQGHEQSTASISLFIEFCDQENLSHTLFELGHELSISSGVLFVEGCNCSDLSSNLFERGHELSVDFVDLYISNIVGQVSISSGSGNLFINGFEQKPALVCPILDPSAAIQITDKLITVYQNNIDALINQLGKNIYLEFDPIRDPCPNCEFDTIRNRSTGIYIPGGPRPFARGRRCPYCKGRGFLETAVNKCIKCLIKWNPSDAKNFGISISQKSGIVRFKTFLTEADDLIRARTVIANHDIAGQMKLKVKLIQGPIPVGLREDRYCISFWELING